MKQFVLGLVLFSSNVLAASSDLAILHRAFYLSKKIEFFLERPDIPRLHFLQSRIEATIKSIEGGSDSDFEVMNRYQELIISFRYSTSYFNQVTTSLTEADISELLNLTEKIAKDKKFDEFLHPHITEDVFNQMHKLIWQLLESHTMPEELGIKLRKLMAPLGFAIAQAKNGDTPDTFQKAVPFAKQVEGLYVDFFKIGSSHSAFNILLEIQGLNEFYLEYAKKTE